MESKVLRSMKLLGVLMLSSYGLLALPAPFSSPMSDVSIGSLSASGAASCIAETGTEETVQFDNMVNVDGTLVLGAYKGGKLWVDLGLSSLATVFRTELSAEGANTGDLSSVVFYAEPSDGVEAAGEVHITVYSDTYFSSGLNSFDTSSLSQAEATYTATNSYDQTVTFSGAGKIVVHIVDGAKVAFDSLFEVAGGSINANSRSFELNEGFVAGTKGTNVYVLMDQTEVEANAPKLTFVRNEFASANGNLDVTVRVGCDSTFVFQSKDDTGLDLDSNGHVLFDISNLYDGRMNLEIAGGGLENQYHDGAFLMYGSWLDAGDYEDPTSQLFFSYKNYFAGNKAIVTVGDDLARTDEEYVSTLGLTEENKFPYYTGNTENLSARGLRVINNCNSTNPFASNPFGDFDFRSGVAPYADRASQVGCVLGVNGTLNIRHNTFFDYIATKIAIPYDADAMGLANLWSYAGNTADVFKKHSPAAFIVDGLDYSGAFISGNFQNSLSLPIVYMQGQSAFHVRCCSDVSGNYNSDYSMANEYYDGTVINAAGFGSDDEGQMVLDIEGEAIFFHDIDPDYDADWIGLSRLNVPPLLLDYAGREVYSSNDLVYRPLVNGTYYDIYQRSCIGLNNDLHLVNMVLEHNSMLHNVTPDPLTSQPAIVGGENAYWWGNYDLMPVVDLSWSDVECHESLASSGVRWVVHDSFGLLPYFGFSDPEWTANVSSIVCYNQGDFNDEYLRHYARVFMLGSSLNKTYGYGTNDYMDTAFLSVYRDSNQFDEAGTPARCVLDVRPQTDYRWSNAYTFNELDQAMQVFALGNDSAIELGWRSTEGYYRFDNLFAPQNAFPWNTNSGDSFSNDLNENQPAELFIQGNGYYFYGLDRNGFLSPPMVNQAGLPGTISVGFGGKLTLSRENPTPHATFDVLIATAAQSETLLGEVDLATDQVTFGADYGVFPHSLDLSLLDPNNLDLMIFAGGTEFSTNIAKISWSNIYQSNSFIPVKTPKGVDLTETRAPSKAPKTRAVTPALNPVALPNSLLQLGAGSYLDQMQVAGATQTNPFHFLVTGALNDAGAVRELTSIPTSPIPVFGEGMFAAIFMNNGGKVGIGSRSWNAHSLNAWNKLGQNAVTLYPDGNCVVELNSDIIINDLNALIPTTNFGDVPTGQAHRITFVSQDAREIRIAAGKELDLSAFGKSTLNNGGDGVNSQQIVLAGKVRLVFEPGSTLRFPDGIDAERAPILYVTEEAEVVIDPVKTLDQTTIFDLATLDKYRVKLQGVGKIWLNKSAKFSIFDEAMVSVEADGVRTNFTWITMSLQREAQLLIGDNNSKGGSLQVGNLVDRPGTGVVFTVRINGSEADFNINRYGFYGLGAGIMAQPEDRVNSWRLVALHNVLLTEMLMIDGSFSHNQIYDGGDEGSLMAIGVADEHDLVLATPVGTRQPVIRGGGNLVHINAEATELSPHELEFNPISNVSMELIDDVLADQGKYTLLASTPMIRQKQSIPFLLEASISQIVSFPGEPELSGARGCQATARGFYQYLSSITTRDQTPRPYACFAINNGQQRTGYLTGAANVALPANQNIVRTITPALLSGVDLERGAHDGFLFGTNPNNSGDSTGFRASRAQTGQNITAV